MNFHALVCVAAVVEATYVNKVALSTSARSGWTQRCSVPAAWTACSISTTAHPLWSTCSRRTTSALVRTPRMSPSLALPLSTQSCACGPSLHPCAGLRTRATACVLSVVASSRTHVLGAALVQPRVGCRVRVGRRRILAHPHAGSRTRATS